MRNLISVLMLYLLFSIPSEAADKWLLYSSNQAGVLEFKASELESHGISMASMSLWATKNTQINNWNEFDHRELTEIPYLQTKNAKNENVILFYIHPTVSWHFDINKKSWSHDDNLYSKQSYVYVSDRAPSVKLKREQRLKDSNAKDIHTYQSLQCMDFRSMNILHSGQAWFSKSYLGVQKTQINYPVSTPFTSMKVEIKGVGSSSNYSQARLYKDGNQIESVHLNRVIDPHEGNAAYPFVFETEVTSKNTILEVNLDGGNDAKYHIDYFQFVINSPLQYRNIPLYFQNSQLIEEGFHGSNWLIKSMGQDMVVWDITSPLAYVQVESTADANGISFKEEYTDIVGRYVAFNPLQVNAKPNFVKVLNNVGVNIDGNPDYIIVYHDDFTTQAHKLKKIHEKELDVELVNYDDIRVNYSGNIPDPNGIRNYLKRRYDKQKSTNHPLLYVLILGRGTYDPYTPTSFENPNYIPCYQSKNSLDGSNTFVSDDIFALMDEGENELSGTVDLAIGRIPCANISQANAVVNKIEGYLSPTNRGDWSTRACVIGDDGDYGLHLKDAEKISEFIKSGYPSIHMNKIYFDAYEKHDDLYRSYPDVTQSIKQFMKDGGLIMNYTGHANTYALAHEKVLEKEDIYMWNNGYHLPLFITATCDFSHWDLKENISAGEEILFHTKGGGIALFTTTRLVYSSSNYQLNKNIYEELFNVDFNGNNQSLGVVMMKAKRKTSGVVNKRKFSLLGDPALKLIIPRWQVETTHINKEIVTGEDITVKLLDPISVQGQLNDEKGNPISQDGEMMVRILDKPIEVQTQGNGTNEIETYTEQVNVLFQAKVPVKNGKFDYVFVLPKDVSYQDGYGRISYYFKNDISDGVGEFFHLRMDGSTGTIHDDGVGPEVSLAINGNIWSSGMTISEEPTWNFTLLDADGINTSLSSVGHQMVLILDNDNTKRYVLNDGFEFNDGDFTQGTITWKPLGLSQGKHHFKLKVWDLMNNSNIIEGDVIIAPILNVRMTSVYPNPTTGVVRVVLENNMAYTTVNGVFEILDFTGASKWSQDISITQSYFVHQINLNEVGITNPGVYFLRLKSVNVNGAESIVTSKIILQ
ncbi:type IX secretion system sortase PorU [Prolixibacteraceae bacterium]|nr:type IX secretion system sortase PorU [Prolixibacteraceae bacterium]